MAMRRGGADERSRYPIRDDFGPESDVDVLVDPMPGYLQTIEEYDVVITALSALFGRPVDLVERATLQRNPSPTLTREILATAQVIYAHGGSVESVWL